MYDSTTASDIPSTALAVAGYIDGAFKWSDADWARFPNARKVRIACFPTTNDGVVLDCETGDASPEQCPGWIQMRQADGVAVPTIYTMPSRVAAVQAACAGLTYDLWVADPAPDGMTPGTPHFYPGTLATQYAWPSYGSGGHYDLSLCRPEWPRG
jgi:hypothetical protein